MTGKIAILPTGRQKPSRPDLTAVVTELRHSRETAHNIRLGGKVTEVPSAVAIAGVLDGLVTSLFPTHLGPHGLNHESVDLFVTNTLSTSLARLGDQIARGLQFDARGIAPLEAQHRVDAITQGLARQLAPIRALLVSDLRAAQARDTATQSLAEVLICHPSSRAIIHHRIAHALHVLGARFVARIIAALAQSTTGIDIHPAARIGEGFSIAPGTGVVIGETAILGRDVCLHHGVTLGENEPAHGASPPKRIPRHPIIEDNVTIHAGATILGRITVGAGSIIGGNVWLTRSVAPGSVITQAAHAVSTVHNLG